MDKIDTDELRRIVAEATSGPWIYYADLPSTEPDWHIVTTANKMRVLANVHIEPGNAMDEANARLIALAPDLAAEVLASRAREAELQARLDEARAAWEAFEGATITDDHHAAVDRIRAALGIGDHTHD